MIKKGKADDIYEKSYQIYNSNFSLNNALGFMCLLRRARTDGGNHCGDNHRGSR